MTAEPDLRSRRTLWMPALLVGIATAVAAEVSIAVLLYGGPGFARSLTTILVVQALALGAGLGMHTPGPKRGLRRRWLLSLIAYLVATAFATLWMILPAIGNNRLGQGLGLAALAALPLYACGALLAGLSGHASSGWVAGGTSLSRGPAVASTAAFGAALGFVGTGVLLPRAPMPASLLVACLVLLSLGGMIHSSAAAARAPSKVDGHEGSPSGQGPGLEEQGAGSSDMRGGSSDMRGPGSADMRGPESPPLQEPGLEAQGQGDLAARGPGGPETRTDGPSSPTGAGFTRAGEDPPAS